MNRQYLTEDLAQIQRYFPGARATRLRTPFDITPKPQRLVVDIFQAKRNQHEHWRGVARWTS